MAQQDIQSNVVLTADNSQYDQTMVASAQATDSLGSSIDSLGAKMDRLTKSAGRKLIGVSAGDTAALGATTLAYGAWEKQMAGLNAQAAILNKTVAGQKQTFTGYAESVDHLRSNFGMATSEATELTQTISRLSGLPTTGVDKLAQTFGTMGQATQESASGLAASVLQLQKTMGTQPGRETERYANQLTVLAQSTGSSAQGLADFANQIAPVARQVGASQTEVQGLATAFSKAGQDGYQAGTFYVRLMNDISYAAQSGSPRLNQFASLAGVMPKQFKEMGGMEQFNAILTSLAKQGPTAINTLNQLGYEGQRMSKVALTLSQQGGIMGSINAAKAADRDPGAMNRGSAAAMDNMYESLSKLRIELTKTAEAFGKFWAGPASKFFDVLAYGARQLSELASSPLGQLASMVAGLAAPFIAFAGALLIAAKAITTFALARQLLTGAPMAGFKETAALTPEARASMAASGFIPGVGAGRMSLGEQGANIAERPTWARRAMYNTGADLARLTGYQSGQASSLLRTAGGTGLYVAGRGMENFVQPQFGAATVRVPGFPNTGGYNDVTRRMPWISSNRVRDTFGMGPEGPLTRFGGAIREGWQAGAPGAGGGLPGGMAGAEASGGFFSRMRAQAQTGWNTWRTGTTPLQGPAPFVGPLTEEGEQSIKRGYTVTDRRAVKTAGAFTESTEKAVTATEASTRATTAAAAQSERFAKSMAMSEQGVGVFSRALGTTAVTMGAAAGGMVKFGAGLAKNAYSLVGGNPLMGIGALAIGGYMIDKAGKADLNQAFNFDTTGVDPYIQAAGMTSIPTAPRTLSQQAAAKRQTVAQAYRISPTEASSARKGGTYQLTNPDLKGKSSQEAEAILASQWQYIANNPQAIAGAASDMTNLFGVSTSQQILGRLRQGTATQPYFLATQAAHPGSKGITDRFFGRQSAALAQPKIEELFGTISKTTDYLASTQGVASAQAYKTGAFDQSIQAFNRGLSGSSLTGQKSSQANDEVVGTFYRGLLEQLGVTKDISNQQAAQLGTPTSLSDLMKRLVKGTSYGSIKYAPILAGDDLKQALSAAGVSNTDLTGDAALAAWMKQQEARTPAQEKRRADAAAQLSQQTFGTFGAGGVLALPSVSRALTGGVGDPTAQYNAIQGVVQGLASTGAGAPGQISQLLQMQKTAGQVPGLGSDIFTGAYNQIMQNQALRAPYLSRTQGFAQATDTFRAVMTGPMTTPDQREQEKATYAAQVQDQYNYVKQQLYQQREYDVSRSRAEDAYHLQRTYQQEDYNITRNREEEEYNISRSRAIRDFHTSMTEAQQSYDIQRHRAEEDHDHQVKMMIQSQAAAYTNAYERVAVQRTDSSPWVAANINDQTRRINQQTDDLRRARAMGVTNRTIQQLGLNSPEHAQELARMIGEMQRDPRIVRQMNQAVRNNIKAAGGLATDASQKDWNEFQRQYHQNMRRGAADFDRNTELSTKHFQTQLGDMQDNYQRMMHNQESDNERMLNRQEAAYNLSMTQAAQDLERSARTIDGNFEQILRQGTTKLSGHARAQAAAALGEFDNLNQKVSPKAVALKSYLANVFDFDWTPPPPIGATGASPTPGTRGGGDPATGVPSGPGHTVGGAKGMVMPGYTPGRDIYNINVSGGEAIMRPEWVRAMGGEKVIESINHKAAHGGFAAGGVVRPIHENVSRGLHDTGTPFPAVDFAAPVGSTVYAVSGGKIVRSYDIAGPLKSDTYHNAKYGPYGSYGRVMYLQTDLGPEVLYAHLSKRGYNAGTRVKTGEPIGLSGSAGNSSGPHLHFGDSDGNPYEFIRGVGDAPGAWHGAGVTGDTQITSGAGTLNVPPLRQIIQRLYPGIEQLAQTFVGTHVPTGTYSRMINQMVRSNYRKLLRNARGHHQVGTGMGAAPAPGGLHGNQALMRQAMREQGWSQWPALYNLEMGEAGFNPNAQNPTSTAYGMGQFLDSTWAGVGGHKTSDPWLQAVYMMRYIKNTYGDPNHAWAKWQSRDPHWYGQGSLFTGPQEIGVGEHGPEAVIPLDDRGADFIRKISVGAEGRGGLGSSPMGGGVTVMNYRIDKSTTFSGPITVQANDPNEMLAKLQARNRLQALTRPALTGSHA